MTIQDFHQEFKIGLDKVDSLASPNFLAEEIDSILNNAQEEFIEQRAYGNNPKKTGLEEDQKRRDDLRDIIKNFTSNVFITTVNNKPNGTFVSLPSDYRHSIQEEADVTYKDCNGVTQTKRIPVVPVTHDRYGVIISDPFNKPFEDELLRLDYEGDMFELITDGTVTITGYHLRYIKQPRKIQFGTAYDPSSFGYGIDQTSELATHTHREIVNKGVTHALQNIESNRYQTNRIKELEIE